MHDKFAIHPFYFKGWEIDFGNGTTVPESSVQINSSGNQKKVSQDWTKAYFTRVEPELTSTMRGGPGLAPAPLTIPPERYRIVRRFPKM